MGSVPIALAINPITNKIYVANRGDDFEVTVIDGATNSTVSVLAGLNANDIVVNLQTNEIYVVNGSSDNVTVIDGNTLTTQLPGYGWTIERLDI